MGEIVRCGWLRSYIMDGYIRYYDEADGNIASIQSSIYIQIALIHPL